MHKMILIFIVTTENTFLDTFNFKERRHTFESALHLEENVYFTSNENNM